MARLLRQAPGRWAARQRPAVAPTVESGRLVALTWAVLRGYPVPEAELVHATRLLGATVNGFLALELTGRFGHRDPAPAISWRRALDALDLVFRTWPAETGPSEGDST